MVATMTKLTSRPMGGERGDKGGHGGWGGGARESATVLLPGSQRWNGIPPDTQSSAAARMTCM